MLADPDTVPEMREDILYEECGQCPEGELCMRCWDLGVVEHLCPEGSEHAC